MGAITKLVRQFYPVGAALALFPLSDIAAKLLPVQLSNVQWRFAGAGMVMSSLAILIIGITVLCVVATVRGDRVFLRILAAVCWLLAAGLVLGAVLFMLDFAQLRGMVPDPAMKAQLSKAAVAALAAGALSTLAFVGLARAAWAASARWTAPPGPVAERGAPTVPRAARRP